MSNRASGGIVSLPQSWCRYGAMRANNSDGGISTSRYGVSFAGGTRLFSLGGEFEQHIVALCLLTQTFELRSSRLYGAGGSSLLGGIGADAIVKSSTNLQNSVSLNSRILAYAAAMRSARTRAWRSR